MDNCSHNRLFFCFCSILAVVAKAATEVMKNCLEASNPKDLFASDENLNELDDLAKKCQEAHPKQADI